MSGPPRVVLRAAVAADLEAIADVERDAGRRFASALPSIADDETVPTEELRAVMGKDQVVVAVVGERIVGYAWWSELDGEAHLEQVSVRCEEEGHGIGRQLIEWTMASARSAGLEAMTLTTFRDIAWNGPLYERYGFSSLADSTLPAGLAERRRAEREAGLDVAPRVAMKRPL